MRNTILYTIFSISLLLLFSCRSNSATADFAKAEQSSDQCMDLIIKEDERLGGIRNHACEKIALSKSIQNYIAELEALDYSNCPDKFTLAFHTHVNAWKEMIPITDQFSELRGEMHDLFKQIEQSDQAEGFSAALAKVWDTWSDVELAMK